MVLHLLGQHFLGVRSIHAIGDPTSNCKSLYSQFEKTAQEIFDASYQSLDLINEERTPPPKNHTWLKVSPSNEQLFIVNPRINPLYKIAQTIFLLFLTHVFHFQDSSEQRDLWRCFFQRLYQYPIAQIQQYADFFEKKCNTLSFQHLVEANCPNVHLLHCLTMKIDAIMEGVEILKYPTLLDPLMVFQATSGYAWHVIYLPKDGSFNVKTQDVFGNVRSITVDVEDAIYPQLLTTYWTDG